MPAAHHLAAMDIDVLGRPHPEITDQRRGQFLFRHPRVRDVDPVLAAAQAPPVREGDLEVELGPVLVSRVVHRVPFLMPVPRLLRRFALAR